MCPNDMENTAFENKYGYFQFLVILIRFRSAQDTFCALVNFFERLYGWVYSDLNWRHSFFWTAQRSTICDVYESFYQECRIKHLCVDKNKYDLKTQATEFFVERIGYKVV